MKKYILFYCFFVLLIQITGCDKKSTKSDPKLNIILWNKPLSTIRDHIQGDWNFIKYSGGFSGGNTANYVNSGELFISGDTIKWWMENHAIEADTIITWLRAESYYFGDSTYKMYFPSVVGNGYATIWTVNEIRNDTLITRDDGFDACLYYFIKK